MSDRFLQTNPQTLSQNQELLQQICIDIIDGIAAKGEYYRLEWDRMEYTDLPGTCLVGWYSFGASGGAYEKFGVFLLRGDTLIVEWREGVHANRLGRATFNLADPGVWSEMSRLCRARLDRIQGYRRGDPWFKPYKRPVINVWSTTTISGRRTLIVSNS